MKFSLFVHMERIEVEEDQRQLYDEMIELCRIAAEGGMHAIWTGEHHGMNFTIAPNPFLNLIDLAGGSPISALAQARSLRPSGIPSAWRERRR